MLDDRSIAAIIEREIPNAHGSSNNQRNEEQTEALNYFFNKARGDEIEGRSQVQATDVSDMVEALMAQMTPMLTKETLIKFEAGGEADEASAEEETEFVRYLIGASSENYCEVTSAIKDALMLKNGWITVYVDTEEYTEKYTKHNIANFQIQSELEESDNEQTITVANIEDAAEGDGFDVQFKRFIHKRNLCVKSVAPENMIWSEDHDRQDLEKIRMLAERRYCTRSELRKSGISESVVKDLASIEPTINSSTNARKDRGSYQVRRNTADTSQEIIETFVCYMHLDIDERGIADCWRVWYADGEVLEKEKAELIPYATGSCFPVPHRLDGQSIFDKLKQNQDMGTGMYRLFMDNVALMNRPRLVYNPTRTEEADVLNARPGGGIRSKDPQGGVTQLQTNDMGMPLINAMQWLDTKRSERAGASLDLGAADMQLAGHNIGNQGAERQISLKEMLAGHMTANLANTLFRNMFLLVHRTVREYMPGELSAKISGKWLQTDATKWQERRKVIVATGLTNGEKTHRTMTLTQVISFIQAGLQAGEDGITVDRPGLYNAMMDWCRAANLSNPEQYFVDPDSDEALQRAEQNSKQAEQMQKMQMQMQQQQTDIFHLQLALEKYKHDSELKFKYDDALLDAEVEEAKIVGQATLDLQRQQRDTAQAAAQQQEASRPAPEAANG